MDTRHRPACLRSPAARLLAKAFAGARAVALARVLAGASAGALAVALALTVLVPAARAQFDASEVTNLRLGPGDWTYDAVPGAAFYSIHRSVSPTGGFACLLDGHPDTSWSGDPEDPPPGGLFAYLVTAHDGDRLDNSPGQGSTGRPRELAVPCPRCPGGTLPLAGRPDLALELVGAFATPMFALALPGDERIFVLERAGRVIVRWPDGTRATFLDITDRVLSPTGETGLLGMAFHPDHESNGRFYLHYSATGCTANCGRVSEFQLGPTPDAGDPASERLLLEVNQPFNNHNGGWIGFDPDGMLLVALGDGGSANDPLNAGQRLDTLLGKILRLDVDGQDLGLEYAIPPDNPFFGDADPTVRQEIWSYGLRNPWRNSIDRGTGDFYIADVGQNALEEVNVAPEARGRGRGVNYGWRLMEGSQCFNPPVNCDPAGVTTLPDYEYAHVGPGCSGSVTGGHVYRGCRMPGWHGTYFFGDFCRGFVRRFTWDGAAATDVVDVFPPGGVGQLASFGEDGAGEILVIRLSGDVLRIVPAP